MDYLRKINDSKADDDKENFQPSRTLLINIFLFYFVKLRRTF